MRRSKRRRLAREKRRARRPNREKVLEALRSGDVKKAFDELIKFAHTLK